MKKKDLYDIFSFMLSRPPCSSGLRLRSEPELARIFGVPRQTVRRALDVFVNDGYLSRKHGSGTYVRKVYSQENAMPEEQVRKISGEIIPEQLFIDNAQQLTHCPEQKKHQLSIGISGDPALLLRANNLIYSGICKRLKEHGCKAVPYSQLSYDTTRIKDADELVKEISSHQCDGYLIEYWWADLFKEVFNRVFGENSNIPVTYFWNGSIDIELEPLVKIDTDEALSRAMRKFIRNNYKKIAIIVMNRSRHSPFAEINLYRQSLAEANLDFQAILQVKDIVGTGLKEQLDHIWKTNRPDAIYVADDHFLSVLYEWMSENKIIPGKNLAVITLWNNGGPFPGDIDWSRMQFDPRQVGYMAVDNIVKSIQSTREDVCSFSHQAKWIAGETINL